MTPSASHDQVPRIGVLTFTLTAQAFQQGFREGLREDGYVEGQNIIVEWRSAEGRIDRATSVEQTGGSHALPRGCSPRR